MKKFKTWTWEKNNFSSTTSSPKSKYSDTARESSMGKKYISTWKFILVYAWGVCTQEDFIWVQEIPQLVLGTTHVAILTGTYWRQECIFHNTQSSWLVLTTIMACWALSRVLSNSSTEHLFGRCKHNSLTYNIIYAAGYKNLGTYVCCVVVLNV